MIKYCMDASLEPTIPSLGPWPIRDEVGYQVLLAQLRYSQEKGIKQHSKS